jgi:hypothetical protein
MFCQSTVGVPLIVINSDVALFASALRLSRDHYYLVFAILIYFPLRHFPQLAQLVVCGNSQPAPVMAQGA